MAATEQAFAALPFAGSGGRLVASPFQFLTSGEDNLRVVSANALTGVRLAIQGRRIDDKGALGAFSFFHTPNTDRTVKTEVFPLGLGAILNAVVFVDAGTPAFGQVYVMLQIVRGFAGPTVLLGTLLAGPVTSAQGLAYPGSPLVASFEVDPYLRVITGTTPAAGAEIAETVPTGARWELSRFSARLSTAGAGRIPALKIKSASGLVETQIGMPTAFSFGAYCDYTWGQGLDSVDHNNPQQFMTAPVPIGLLLGEGEMLTTVTAALGAADQWSNVVYAVRESLVVG